MTDRRVERVTPGHSQITNAPLRISMYLKAPYKLLGPTKHKQPSKQRRQQRNDPNAQPSISPLGGECTHRADNLCSPATHRVSQEVVRVVYGVDNSFRWNTSRYPLD